MKVLSTKQLVYVSGGGDPMSVNPSGRSGAPGGDLADTYRNATTHTYDDGSTLTVNSDGDPIRVTAANGQSLSVAWGDCVSAAGAAGVTALSSGLLAVFGAMGTVGAGMNCYNNSNWVWPDRQK